MYPRTKSRLEFRANRNAVMFSVERYMITVLNNLGLPAEFDVALSGNFKQSQEEVAQFIYDGEVFMYPDAPKKYPVLPKFRTSDGGINLSALRRSKFFEKNASAPGAADMLSLLDSVFKTLNNDALRPLEKIVTDAQRSVGYINHRKKGLNIACDPSADSPETVNLCLDLVTTHLVSIESASTES